MMQRSQFYKYILLLIILPLFSLPGCDRSGDQTMQNNRQAQNDQNAGTKTPSEDQTFPDELSAAKKALEIFPQLINAENFKTMGFESAEEVKSATLGAPMRVSLVRLDQLKEYQAGADAARLLNDINRVIYPVMVRDQVRSSIEVKGENGKWRITSLGSPRLAKKISEVQKQAGAPDESDARLMLVHVAALNVYFIGQGSGDKLMLTNVFPVPGTRLAEPVTMPAAEALGLLVPIAKDHNGLPT